MATIRLENVRRGCVRGVAFWTKKTYKQKISPQWRGSFLKRHNRNLKDMTMPKLQAARVTQCGLDFAVVLVDPKLFLNPSELEAFSERAQALFPGVPVAMLSYDDLKVTRYHGPDDVVAFLKQVRVVSLPWVEYTIGE